MSSAAPNEVPLFPEISQAFLKKKFFFIDEYSAYPSSYNLGTSMITPLKKYYCVLFKSIFLLISEREREREK